MLQEPDVRILAEQMQSVIDEALADEASLPRKPAMAAQSEQSIKSFYVMSLE